ncbi:MAG: tRNA (N(6)-L-threonylcarbamoyladenosine(37)-C(2))-methylthiotransferase MtaB [Alphaproteobacteria bacterium]|nr:tRNA (N(6)-L-threonylcarbamoyladenosine(37)-C(2))-methylthiotransferase MtaB [Alphaproteobacteria bacterium]
MTNRIVTFGCRENSYESAVIKDIAGESELDNAIIINTCAVTGEAERQARQAIRKLRRENPDAFIIVTGCSAQVSPEKYAEMPEVDKVLGNIEKLHHENYKKEKSVQVADIMSATETSNHFLEEFEGRSRAFVQVQQGCDYRCTYCIVPFARGANRSEPPSRVVEQVKRLVANGYSEIVLTGVDISSYKTNSLSLSGLLKKLLDEIPELDRLRLSSLDPAGIDDEFIELIGAEPRFMPHLHLSVQSGDDTILKRMKRRHNRTDVINLCKKIRLKRPDIAIGADIITGFPTETEEMFENTLKLVEECNLTHLHVFPYSIRTGTPAAKMPQVRGDMAKERANRLRKKGDELMKKYLSSFIGKNVKVLVEKSDRGYSGHFVIVLLDKQCESSKIVNVNIKEVRNMELFGEVQA